MEIDRKRIFMDTFNQVNNMSAAELKKPFNIHFKGEAGIDAGGLIRDFFIELSKQMFYPDYALFTLCSNGTSFHPNTDSNVNPDHLQFFRFVGRMIGKALNDGHYLECHFSKPFYKMILGQDLMFEDLLDLENMLHSGYTFTLSNELYDDEMTFTHDEEYFGETKSISLCKDGATKLVTEQNKEEYIQLLAKYQMYDKVKEQVQMFLRGFYELVPRDLISIFNFKELELLIAGLPSFYMDDFKANLDFKNGYHSESQQAIWFIEIIETYSKADLALLLQFVTGSSQIPLDGFGSLQGMTGQQNFNVQKIPGKTQGLPKSHTCFNQLDIPEYETKEIMEEKLRFAITECSGFGDV